jgi:hypothetical protein
MTTNATSAASDSRFFTECRMFRSGNARNAAAPHGDSSASGAACCSKEAGFMQMITRREPGILNQAPDAEEKPRAAGETRSAEARSANRKVNDNQGAMIQWRSKSISINAPAVEIARMCVQWKQSALKMTKPLSAIRALIAARVFQHARITLWRCNLIKRRPYA